VFRFFEGDQVLELKIDVRSWDDTEAFELADWLRSNEPSAEISYYMLIQESAHAHSQLYEIILKYGSQVGSAIAGATLAALKEKIKTWLLKKNECKHRTIPIYGPDEKIVSVVECELKHPEK
jgi:hypothetical protein